MTGRKLNKRWGKNGVGYKGQRFYNSIGKYGWNNFYHELIADNLTLNEAENFEKLLINKLKSNDENYGYNIDAGGNCTRNFTDKGLSKLKKTINNNCIKIICNDIVFNSINDCAKYCNVSRHKLSSWLYGEREMPSEFNLKYFDENKIHKFNVYDEIVFKNKKYKNVRVFSKEMHLSKTNVLQWLNNELPMPEILYQLGLRYSKCKYFKYKTTKRYTIKVKYNKQKYNSVNNFNNNTKIKYSFGYCMRNGLPNNLKGTDLLFFM